ncbi:MAG: ATP-grasp domain-containing protein [Actinobacteria bacterium]|nr:ATP-grasp domain-containing protein [Actinomycetota bacterium]
MKILVIGNIGFDLMAPYLRSEGIETSLVITTPEPLNAEYADNAYFFDSDTDFWPLIELALDEKVDAVISISGPDVANLRDGYVRDTLEKQFGIPVLANPLEAVQIAANKERTKEFLKKHGFPVTEGKIITSKAEAFEVADEYGYPLVLKLVDHSGGTGMKVARNRFELIKSLAVADRLLVEKYADGPEFSVEVLNYGGRTLPLLPVFKGYTNYQCLHPMERVKIAPAPISEIDTAKLRSLARDVIRTLNVQPTGDIDIVWSNGGPKILEINPRFGGVTALSMAASGITSYHALVDMLLGRWNSRDYRFNRHYAADIPIFSDIEIENAKNLLNLDGVFRVKIQKLSQTTGRVALKAKTIQELLDTARQVANLCNCADCLAELRSLPRKLEVAVV